MPDVSELRGKVSIVGIPEAIKDLQRLDTATENVARNFNSGGKSADKYGDQLRHAGSSAGTLGKELGQVDGAARRSASGLDTASKSSSNLDRSMSSATRSVAAFAAAQVGIAAGAAGVKSAIDSTIGSAMELEKAVLSIKSISPEIDTSAVADSLNDMTTRVAQSASQLGTSMYDVMASIEVGTGDALMLVEQFAKGAIAAQTDASTFGQSILGVLNAYGLSAADATHVSDVFFNTIKTGVVTGKELASSLGPVTQSAKAAGLSIDELGAYIAAVTREGGPAAQNINNLNNFLQKVSTKDAQKEINNLGVATVDSAGKFRPMAAVLTDLRGRLEGMTEAARANALATIFPDAQARMGAAVIMSQLDTVNKGIEENKTVVGTADQAYKTMASSASVQLDLLINKWRAMGTAAGTEALPAIVGGMDAITSALQSEAFGTFVAGATSIGESLLRIKSGLEAMPDPLQKTVLGVTALNAALIAFSMNPAVATVGGLAAAWVYMSGQVEQGNNRIIYSTDQITAVAARLSAEATGPVKEFGIAMTAALRDIDAGSGSVTAKVEALRAAYERENLAMQDNAAKAGALAEAKSKVIAEADKGTISLGRFGYVIAASADQQEAAAEKARELQAGIDAAREAAGAASGNIDILNRMGAQLGISFERGADGLIKVKDIAGNLRMAEAAAQFDPMQDALKEVVSNAGKASEAIRKLLSPPTGAEVGVAAQIDAITAAQKNFAAATRTSDQVQADFTTETRNWLNTAQLAPEVLAEANRVLDSFAAGNLDAAAAQKELDRVLKPTADTLAAVAEGLSSTRTALGSAAEAEMEAARQWNGSMEDRKRSASEFVNVVKGVFPELAPAAQAAATDTTAAINTIGQGSAETVQATTTAVGIGAAQGIAIGWGQTFPAIQGRIYADVASLANIAIPQAAGVESPSKITALAGGYMAEGVGVGWSGSWRGVVGQISGDIRRGVYDVVEVAQAGASDLAASLASIGEGPLRGLQQEIASTGVELARMRTEMLSLDPKGEAAKALKEQQRELESYRGELQATVRAQREAGSAIEGFFTSMSRGFERFDLSRRFGEEGADSIAALREAFESGEAGAGDALASTLMRVIARAKEANVPGWRESGEELWRVFDIALNGRTPETIDAALSALETFATRTEDVVYRASSEWKAYQEQIAAVHLAQMKLPGVALQVAQSTGLQKTAVEALRAAYGGATAAGGVFGSHLTDLSVMLSNVQRGAFSAASAIDVMNKAVAGGTAEAARADREGGAIGAIQAQLKALSTASDPTKITEYTARVRELGRLTGIPDSVIESVMRLANESQLAGNLTGEANRRAADAIQARIDAEQRNIESAQQEIARLQGITYATEAEAKARDQRVAIMQGQIQTSQGLVTSMNREKDALSKQESGLDAVNKVLQPYAENRRDAADADRSYLDAISKGTAAQVESLPTLQEMTASVRALGMALGGDQFLSNLEESRRHVAELGAAAGITTDNLADVPAEARDAARGIAATESAAASAQREVSGYSQTLSTAFSMFDRLGEQARGGGQFVGWSFTGGFDQAMKDGIPGLETTAGLLVDRVIGAAKDRLEAHSPSEKAARELGDPIPLGMADGVLRTAGTAITAVVAVSGAMVDAAIGEIGRLNTYLQSNLITTDPYEEANASTAERIAAWEAMDPLTRGPKPGWRFHMDANMRRMIGYSAGVGRWNPSFGAAVAGLPHFAGGGPVRETGPAIVHAGEFVMNKAAVNAFEGGSSGTNRWEGPMARFQEWLEDHPGAGYYDWLHASYASGGGGVLDALGGLAGLSTTSENGGVTKVEIDYQELAREFVAAWKETGGKQPINITIRDDRSRPFGDDRSINTYMGR